MLGLLLGFTIFLAIIGIVGAVVFMQVRKSTREAKLFERGLKMVPMLIHLPPPSDDTEVGGRDTRDVTDETISRAQTIYNIIGSTYQRGFKAKFAGQRHFAFEIVATGGFVNFYVAVPVSLQEIIKQAIVSAYPAARLEEVTEHNIFNAAGKLSGVAGGEMVLKESYAYPIATYQDIKRDALQSVLNALSSLEKEDGAAIQIVLRPSHHAWRKTAHKLASDKRKGSDKTLSPFQLFVQFLSAFLRPPEDKKGGGEKKELSNLEQSNLDAIDQKTQSVGYDSQIRIVVSSNISQRSQALVSNIVASFSLFDAPGKNGFRYEPSKDPVALVADYNLRAYRPSKKLDVLNAVELATLFHFPDQRNIPTTQVVRQDSKQVDGPRNVPEDGLLLGYNEFRGAKKPIRIALQDRQRHLYAVGQT
ncbi:MAG: ATP-binding protein, partial [Candidatus Saccharimonadales bacterium]